MNRNEVADILEHIAVLLDLKGENHFKIRAYENAARSVRAIPDEIDVFIKNHKLSEIKGIGKALDEKITQLVTTGKLEYYEELQASIPPSLIEMTRIPNLGPKRIRQINKLLKISTIHHLEAACRNDIIAQLEGFGKKSQEKILEGIQSIKKYRDKYLFSIAEEEADRIFQELRKNKYIKRLSFAGSLRRKKEIIGDIDLVASTSNNKHVMDAFISLYNVESIIAKGDTKSTISLASGIHADLRVVTDKQFPYTLHHLTGSKEHNIAMRSRALKMGMKINEYGLFKGKKLIPVEDEKGLFEKLGLAYIEPELREDNGEIEAAEKGKLPKLIEEKDIRGILHVHTTYSDGMSTLAEMAETAKSMGYEYLGISEHSQSATYAGGMFPDDIKRQFDEIDKLNEKYKKFRVIKGIEVEILTDGSIDYDDKLLESFEFVIAAVHSNFNMSEDDMTRRIIKAVENRHVTMLAHPTGRLLLEREPYRVNIHAVIDTAAEHKKIIEINSNPHRLDLDWRFCKYAIQKGIKISINTDSHRANQLHEIRYGIGIARKGQLTKSDVLNTLPLAKLLAFLKK